MAKDDNIDSQNSNSHSERIDNLSEERRKLLEAMMERDSFEDQKSDSDSDKSEQPENEGRNQFEEREINPPPDMGQNPFAGMGMNPPPGMGQNPFAGMGMNPPPGMGQNPFTATGMNTPPGMGSNPFENFGFSGSWENFFGNQGGAPPNTPPSTPLVAMKPSGSRPPFFCVHAVMGSVFPYHKLAMLMEKDQPFYGIQAPAVNGKKSPSATIEDMAAEYIQAISSVQNKGPYYLGGYSFGGWVAYEMARQLISDGEKVNLLAIFGTTAPPLSNPVMEKFKYYSQYMEDFNKFVLNSALADNVRMADWSAHNGFTSNPLFRMYEINTRAQISYSTKPCSVKSDLFLTGELRELFAFDQSLGWNMFCSEVENHYVSGNHLSTFHEPHVKDLAEKVTACLKRAQEKHV